MSTRDLNISGDQSNCEHHQGNIKILHALTASQPVTTELRSCQIMMGSGLESLSLVSRPLTKVLIGQQHSAWHGPVNCWSSPWSATAWTFIREKITGTWQIRSRRIRQIPQHLSNCQRSKFLFVSNIFNISYSTIKAAVSLQLLQGFPCFSQVTKQTASLEIYKDKDTTEDTSQ